MAEQQKFGRIQLKHDTTANWALATNFYPKQGEAIIYQDGAFGIPQVKYGAQNEDKTPSELPFSGTIISFRDWSKS